MIILNKFYKLLFVFAFIFTFIMFESNDAVEAQDIPELHMIVFQGDVFLAGSPVKTSSLDGYTIEAKIGDQVVGSAKIAQNLTGRYSGLEVGPNIELEGKSISFWIGNQKAMETAIFGPLTVSGDYCKGCTWSLPLSRVQPLHFDSLPLPTPTPAPASVLPTFLTGTIIFGSVLAAPEGFGTIEAYVDDELIGKGSVNGSEYSITLDPGNETYLGKPVVFNIAGYNSKTTYKFVDDAFITDFKLFFPEYIPPSPTPTPPPVATAVPTATSTPEPTRTPTPVPEPTPTYTPTPTPTPIAVNTSADLLTEESDGGCNSRGGGPASVGLIVLSLVPVYILNRRKRVR